MNVSILGEGFAFPVGMAATQRVFLLAKGLVARGVRVNIFIIRGTEQSNTVLNKEIEGKSGEINYYYTVSSTIIPRNWILRRIQEVSGIISALSKLNSLKKRNSLDALILYTRRYSVVRLFSLFARIKSIPVILDICEWPMASTGRSWLAKRNAKKYCSKGLEVVKALLPISHYIQSEIEKHLNKVGKTISILRIPILVNMEKFKSDEQGKTITPPVLLFSGSLSYQELIKIIISFASALKKAGQVFKLNITGVGTKTDVNFLNYQISKYDLHDVVAYLGYLNESEFVKAVQKAYLLLCPLTNDTKHISRFPTKLGEYLASGRPVLTNRIGEVDFYLKDNLNAFVCDSVNIEVLKEKTIYVLNNIEKAQLVGKSGQETARKEFDYLVQGEKMLNFINNLISTCRTKSSK